MVVRLFLLLCLAFLRVTAGERELDLVPFIVCCRPGGAGGYIELIPVYIQACLQQFQLHIMGVLYNKELLKVLVKTLKDC